MEIWKRLRGTENNEIPKNIVLLSDYKSQKTNERIAQIGLGPLELEAVHIISEREIAVMRAREGAAMREALRVTNHSKQEIDEIQRITNEISNQTNDSKNQVKK